MRNIFNLILSKLILITSILGCTIYNAPKSDDLKTPETLIVYYVDQFTNPFVPMNCEDLSELSERQRFINKKVIIDKSVLLELYKSFEKVDEKTELDSLRITELSEVRLIFLSSHKVILDCCYYMGAFYMNGQSYKFKNSADFVLEFLVNQGIRIELIEVD